jgi:metal-responsive CopG/Arc/MetJ family transcriptional regulator
MVNKIISVVLERRNEEAPSFQEILTRHGCIIKIRLGVHEIEGCANKGLIILVVRGSKEEVDNLVNDLKNEPTVKTNLLEID